MNVKTAFNYDFSSREYVIIMLKGKNAVSKRLQGLHKVRNLKIVVLLRAILEFLTGFIGLP